MFPTKKRIVADVCRWLQHDSISLEHDDVMQILDACGYTVLRVTAAERKDIGEIVVHTNSTSSGASKDYMREHVAPRIKANAVAGIPVRITKVNADTFECKACYELLVKRKAKLTEPILNDRLKTGGGNPANLGPD